MFKHFGDSDSLSNRKIDIINNFITYITEKDKYENEYDPDCTHVNGSFLQRYIHGGFVRDLVLKIWQDIENSDEVNISDEGDQSNEVSISDEVNISESPSFSEFQHEASLPNDIDLSAYSLNGYERVIRAIDYFGEKHGYKSKTEEIQHYYFDSEKYILKFTFFVLDQIVENPKYEKYRELINMKVLEIKELYEEQKEEKKHEEEEEFSWYRKAYTKCNETFEQIENETGIKIDLSILTEFPQFGATYRITLSDDYGASLNFDICYRSDECVEWVKKSNVDIQLCDFNINGLSLSHLFFDHVNHDKMKTSHYINVIKHIISKKFVSLIKCDRSDPESVFCKRYEKLVKRGYTEMDDSFKLPKLSEEQITKFKSKISSLFNYNNL